MRGLIWHFATNIIARAGRYGYTVLVMKTEMNIKDDRPEDDSDLGVALKTRPKVSKPSMYKVVMLNDDYTPMEFVVLVLMEIFRKTAEDATKIMLQVHQKGAGICGVYTYEVAETKVSQVMSLAKKNQHPLQLQVEKE